MSLVEGNPQSTSKKTKKFKTKASETGDVPKKRKLDEVGLDEEVDEEAKQRAERKERKKLRKIARLAKQEASAPSSESPVIGQDALGPSEEKNKKKKFPDIAVDDPPSSSTTAVGTPSNGSSSPADISSYLKKHSITIHGDITPILNFSQLPVSPELLESLKAFKEPTPIQACAWPALLLGHDVVGIAETGSGKTLAFGLPALSRLISQPLPRKSKGPQVSVLVVAPTRELALQTHETLSALGEPFNIASVCLFGGMDKSEQKRSMGGSKGKTVRIVVGTPGRILDMINDGSVDLSGVTYLVLDEADRMLDKGFENDIRSIISNTTDGVNRQTLMFSATWPDSVRRLAATFQKNPIRVTVGSDDLTANSRVTQEVDVFDNPRLKDQRLENLLKKLKHRENYVPGSDESRIIIFVLYKKEAARVERYLWDLGYSVGGIHGDLGQQQRMKALDDFKTGKTGLLVATDVAARGLDIPNVGVVINYSFPLTVEDYVHRIGRTGRGGRSGQSVTFFTGENHERALAGELMRVLRDSGFEAEGLKKFPMTVKKREHSAYGAFFKESGPETVAPKKIKF